MDNSKQFRKAIFQLRQFKENCDFFAQLINNYFIGHEYNTGFSTKCPGAENFPKQIIDKSIETDRLRGNPLIRQLGEKVCILHDGISRQKQIPNWPTSANIPVFEKRTRASTNNYGRFNIFSVLSKLFERLFSNQLVEFFQRILSKFQCSFILRKAMACNIAYKWCLKLERERLIIKNKSFGVLLTGLSQAFDCLSDNLVIANFHANGLHLLSRA